MNLNIFKGSSHWIQHLLCDATVPAESGKVSATVLQCLSHTIVFHLRFCVYRPICLALEHLNTIPSHRAKNLFSIGESVRGLGLKCCIKSFIVISHMGSVGYMWMPLYAQVYN